MELSYDIDLDKILENSTKLHPEGSRKFEKELKHLKFNLNGEQGFLCEVCNTVIKHKGTYNRHVKSHKNSFKCFLCGVKFTREENLKKRGHLSGYKKSRCPI